MITKKTKQKKQMRKILRRQLAKKKKNHKMFLNVAEFVFVCLG